MSFLGSIANSLADRVKRAAGVVPPYEVVEATAQQFARFVAIIYHLYSQSLVIFVSCIILPYEGGLLKRVHSAKNRCTMC